MTSIPQVHPSIPKDGEAFRLQIIANIQNDLSIFMEQDRSLATRQQKKLDRCREAAGWLGSIGTAVSVAGGTVGATGIGVIPGGVLIGVGCIFGVGSVIAFKLEERVLKKLIKHDKLTSLAEAKLFSLRDKTSMALKDEKISDEEFKEINEEMRKHAMQRSEILNDGKKLKRSSLSKNGASSSTKELADHLAAALNAMKRSATSS